MKRQFLVAAALFLVAGMASAQWRSDRPVRGVWLRPPATPALLETNLQAFARAGITDLYLETFFHGVSTGKQGVFNRRFGFDYLASVIPLAARYNIRLHAWVEAGYWQLGTTGAYNFTANPEWRVINRATGAVGGDQAGQVFANLGHPGVQAKLRAYCTELALYDGLWSVQTDYHRMPVDNDTADVYTAPWSYDTWSATTFAAANPGVNIQTQASQPGQPFWNAFLTWRRNGISEAARQMFLGVQTGSADVEFSGAIFATAMTSGAQVAKCQDWPSWASGGYIDAVVPMAYGSSITSIRSDLASAKTQSSGRKVIAGLAILAGRPAIESQLSDAKTRNSIEDYILWEGNQLTAEQEAALTTWISSGATPMRADFNANQVLDLDDYHQWLTGYAGVPLSAPVADRRNWDGDGDIDTADHARIRRAISAYRVGPRGILTQGDRNQFALADAAAPSVNAGGVRNLYDYDQDGDVDEADRRAMEKLGWTGPMARVVVNLSDVSNPAPRDMVFEWRTSGGGLAKSWTERVTSGTAIWVPVPSNGSYTLSLKVEHWLRRSLTISTTTMDVPTQTLSLRNGDANGDNEVGAADFSALAAAYDAVIGDPEFNSSADLNEDGEVGAADFSIVAANYDEVGD